MARCRASPVTQISPALLVPIYPPSISPLQLSSISSYSSSSLAYPVIPGRRYNWWCYFWLLPFLLCCPLPVPALSYLSYTVHLRFGRPLLLSLVYPHLAFLSLCALFSLCASLSPSSYGRMTSFVFCNFLGRLHQSCGPSNAFISDHIPPSPSTYPSQQPRLMWF